MAFASVQDVEARLGVTLSPGDAQTLGFYLDDFSLFLKATIKQYGYKVEDIDEDVLKMVTARRGATWQLSSETPFGVSSISETNLDTSTSISYTAAASGSETVYFLTQQEKVLLGLVTSSIQSFTMVTEERYRYDRRSR